MVQAIEVPLEKNITQKRFWQMAQDLLYTKLFYDDSTKTFTTKRYNCPEAPISTAVDGKKSGEESIHSNGTSISDAKSKNVIESKEDLAPCTVDEMNTLLVSYLTLVSNYCDSLAIKDKDPDFFKKVSQYILSYNNYERYQTFCVRKMLSLVLYAVNSNAQNLQLKSDKLSKDLCARVVQTIETNEKFLKIIGWIFYSSYNLLKEQFVTILKSYRGIEAILKVLNNYCSVSKNVGDDDPFEEDYFPYLELVFKICQGLELKPEQLDIINAEFLKFAAKHLNAETEEENQLNYVKFRLLLILNEQYMVRQYTQKDADKSQIYKNQLFCVLVENGHIFQNFMEVLVLNFNRETNPTVQILMLKALYVVFTTSSTCQLIYLNDLEVIMDIMIRELCNLSLVKDGILINTYLRVLYPMLLFSNLNGKKYKVDSLRSILRYLCTSEQTNETTERLAKRCLELDIFQQEATNFPEPLEENDGESSDSSSVTTVKSASPAMYPVQHSSMFMLSKDKKKSMSSSQSLPAMSKGRRSQSLCQKAPVPPRPRNWSSANSVPHVFVQRVDSGSSQASSVDSINTTASMFVTDSYIDKNNSSFAIRSTPVLVQNKPSAKKLAPPPPPRRKTASSSDIQLSRAKVFK
ncbi:hypothetical protein HII12_001801 [Brettanomyces bruxellensis]|uniref:DEBR0S1_04742g1_1 n=1 Tax=Dekkera bruxellensis TaxID=5007 RepID=A0A7D9GYA5_DEKBR|nr:hypothetical protein HII12_001801 [Brettanomyces bruxellensis]VUG15988.1 DEBR0S1_04742g1_1 [Brettanomyces bruxellensis]